MPVIEAIRMTYVINYLRNPMNLLQQYFERSVLQQNQSWIHKQGEAASLYAPHIVVAQESVKEKHLQ